jgi:hypothetical protein
MSLTFSSRNYSTGINPSSVAIGDLNGDGRLDLVTANIGGDPNASSLPAGTISVLLGSGGGTFSAATPYPTGSVIPLSVAIGDLNGDGRLDLAVANFGDPLSGVGTISVFLGNGNGTFSAATQYPTGTGLPGAQSVAIGDLNGDGRLDLAVADASNKLPLLLGTVGGGFLTQTPPLSFSGINNPGSIAIGDLDGNGRLDLALTNFGAPPGPPGTTVTVLYGNVGGGFNRVNLTTGTSPSSVAIDDLNGDGHLDLAVANAGSNTVSVLLNDGNGNLSAATPYPTGANPGSVAIGDLNGDGRADLAIANHDSNTVSVLLGNVGGGFQQQTQYPTGLGPSSVAIGDLNGDGRLDLAVAAADSNNVTVLLSARADHDFNGDGHGDILWRHDNGQVYLWEMEGLGIKAEGSVAHAPVPNDWHIEGTGDFDGDFNSDILWRHDSGQVYFWEMNGLAIKAEGGVMHAPVPNDWHIQGTGDFDADGKSDVLWRHDSGQVYIWEMNGLGTKAEGSPPHAPVPNDWHIEGTGDFDGDGKSDILWRHDSGQVYIWEMDGLGIKAEGGIVHDPVPNDWHIEGIGDFGGDGKSDLLWRHDSGQVYIWEMNGLGVKAEGTVVHAPVPNDWHVEDVGDYNSDGKSGDILWRHDSGQVYTWEMNGLGIIAEGAVAHAPVPSDWHIFSDQNFI